MVYNNCENAFMNCAIRRNHFVLFLCLLKLSFILLTTESAAASTWQQGFDFRNTSTFVTDPSGDTYVGPTTAYPTKNNGGTFGWVKTSLVQARDRSTAVDPRLAGINFANNGAPATFYVDLPSAGTYNLSLALGDAGYQQCWVQCQIQFLDGSTVLATVTGGSVNARLLLRCHRKSVVSRGLAERQPKPAGNADGHAVDRGSGHEQGHRRLYDDRLLRGDASLRRFRRTTPSRRRLLRSACSKAIREHPRLRRPSAAASTAPSAYPLRVCRRERP